MEKLPNIPGASEDNTPTPIENPYFFDETKDRRIERNLTKRSLEKVGKMRGSREYPEYSQSMKNLLDRKLENNLDKAMEDFCRYELKHGGSLTPLVALQNEVTSILSGLEESDRISLVGNSRQAVERWLEDNPKYRGLEGKIKSSFDGSLAACLYMDKQREQYGERVEFYSDAFLDERRSVDLLEVVSYGRSEVEIRLVQNKSSLGPQEERQAEINKTHDNHGWWVREELFGTNEILDHFMRVLEVERSSKHHEDLKEMIVDTYADIAVSILELRRTEKEGGSTRSLNGFFESKGVSQLSKYALLFAFYEEGGRDTSGLEAEIRDMIKQENRENIFSSLNVSKVESVFAVDDEVISSLTIHGRRDEKDLFLGIESTN